mmetsp:Transcript_10922/g.13796  ORF Transcript_10922/g.13796 Transcript_10922/m.13796 type:complete len:92 (+) Transcript_10922:320-595(+)
MQTIRSIDKDKNGFVTNQELEDIIKLHYTELQKYDLKLLFKKFASQSNRLLINYAAFREGILKELEKLEVSAAPGSLTDRDQRQTQPLHRR